jgi:hypothetical protein
MWCTLIWEHIISEQKLNIIFGIAFFFFPQNFILATKVFFFHLAVWVLFANSWHYNPYSCAHNILEQEGIDLVM